MNKLKLAVCFSILLSSIVLISSCKKEKEADRYIQNVAAPLTPAQVVPANASTGGGTITMNYDRKTRLLTYTLNYSGLTGNPTAIHIHGLATPGVVALPAPLGPYTNGIIQSFTSGLPAATAGSFNGSLNIEDVVLKEADLLAGRYYIDIHTATYAASGEIRGQLIFP